MGALPPHPQKGDASLSLHPHDRGASGSPDPRVLIWRSDAAQALVDAFASGRPVLVDFWAQWCGPCHEMDRKTFGDARVQAALERFVLVRVDVTTPSAQSGEMTARYGVVGYPTLLLIDGQGVLRERIERFVGVDAMLGALAGIE